MRVIRAQRVLDMVAALIAVIVMVPASAQQTPPSPPLLAFGDSQIWIMLGPLEYTIGITRDRIVVPAGFVSTENDRGPLAVHIDLSLHQWTSGAFGLADRNHQMVRNNRSDT